MTHRPRATAALAAVAALLAGGCGAAAGSPAQGRNFNLRVVRNPDTRVSLAAYAGRPVIVSFFSSYCLTCMPETATLARYYRFNHRHHGDVTIIGIDPSDQPAAALSLLNQAGVSFPVLADPSMTTATAFGTPGLPATFFLNARHHVVRKVLGPITLQQLTTGSNRINGTQPAAAPSASPPG